jgi:hypothetical protein
LQGLQDRFDYPAGIVQNIVVPEPDHSPTLAFEPSCSVRVQRIVRVLIAIDFDHQRVLGTGEVDDEVSNRMLSPKSVSRQASMA